MARRSTQRREAVFALYQADVTGQGLDDLFSGSTSEFTRALAHATQDNLEEIDGHIRRHAEGWTLERIAPLERAILRAALLEMLHPDIVPADSPISPEGAIDAAVEMAKTYSGAQAPGFVNGILGAVLREMSETAR
jgi:N utilization substance protein B